MKCNVSNQLHSCAPLVRVIVKHFLSPKSAVVSVWPLPDVLLPSHLTARDLPAWFEDNRKCVVLTGELKTKVRTDRGCQEHFPAYEEVGK